MFITVVSAGYAPTGVGDSVETTCQLALLSDCGVLPSSQCRNNKAAHCHGAELSIDETLSWLQWAAVSVIDLKMRLQNCCNK